MIILSQLLNLKKGSHEANLLDSFSDALRQYTKHLGFASAAKQKSNDKRLSDWQLRYFVTTGIKPTTKPYQVVFCSVCNKPHWFIDPQHDYLVARCEKHWDDFKVIGHVR